MIDLIQGPVVDALNGCEIYIEDDDQKEGHIVDKQYISNYGDALVCLDNLF